MRRQQGSVIHRLAMINWIRRMRRSTRLSPHQTVPQYKSIIKFLQLLFDQVGQLRPNGYLQGWSGTSSCKVNRHAVEQQGATTFPEIRFNTEQSGGARPSDAPRQTAPHTQVKSNLSLAAWWICSEILSHFDWIVCKSSRDGKIWHLKRRHSILNLSFHLVAPAVEDNLSNSLEDLWWRNRINLLPPGSDPFFRCK